MLGCGVVRLVEFEPLVEYCRLVEFGDKAEGASEALVCRALTNMILVMTAGSSSMGASFSDYAQLEVRFMTEHFPEGAEMLVRCRCLKQEKESLRRHSIARVGPKMLQLD